MLTIQNPYIIIQYREQRLNNMKLKVYITSIHNVILGLICNKYTEYSITEVTDYSYRYNQIM